MSLVYLIRHGESTGDVEDRLGGAYDDDLSLAGIHQARALAEELTESGIQHLYCSTLRRAVETASIVAARLAVPLTADPLLRERNRYGPLSGMTKAEAQARAPADFVRSKIETETISGAEPYDEFMSRIAGAYQTLLARACQHPIGVVWHGGPMRYTLGQILGHGPIEKIGDCGWAKIETTGKILELSRIKTA